MARTYRLKRLNTKGVHHILLPAITFVILFGITGSYFLLTSHAAAWSGALSLGSTGSGWCMEDQNSSKANGAYVVLDKCNHQTDQKWQLNAIGKWNGHEYYTIQSGVGNLCVDNWKQSKTIGASNPMRLFQCNGKDPAEQFVWTDVSTTHQLLNFETDHCIDDIGGHLTVGNRMDMYTCKSGSSASYQEWFEVALGTPSTGGGGGSSGGGSTASAEHIVTTLYADPSVAAWQQAEKAAPTVKYAIVNICAPDGSGSGCGRPADEKDPSWAPTIAALKKAGITPLYYISTNYGKEPLATVKSELANAKSWYGIANPMFDTTATNNTSYYSSLYSYAVGLGATTVMYNPGTQVPQSYMFGSKVIMQVFEGTASDLRSASFPSWMNSYPASEFSATVSAGSAGNIGTDVTDAAHDHIGNYYEDDESEPPNYATLPSYWATEVKDVANIK